VHHLEPEQESPVAKITMRDSQCAGCEPARNPEPPPADLQGTFTAGENVHFTSATYSGDLQYSDAVVLLGTLQDKSGATLAVRLELECKTIEECYAAMEKAKQCE